MRSFLRVRASADVKLSPQELCVSFYFSACFHSIELKLFSVDNLEKLNTHSRGVVKTRLK